MCDLAPILQDVNADPCRPIAFYEYPELYHFFYSRVKTDDRGKEVLEKFQPHNTSRVLELACGTGIVLATIEDRYMEVMGVDVDAGMLDVAREKTNDATLRQADVTSWSAAEEDRTFDAAIMVGSMFHLTGDHDVRALARNVYDSLRDGGTFTSGFLPLADRETNSVKRTRTVESDRYRVEQIKITAFTSQDGHYSAAYRYEITDERKGTTVTIGSVEAERMHDSSLMRQAFDDAGFSEVRVLETDSPKAIINARR